MVCLCAHSHSWLQSQQDLPAYSSSLDITVSFQSILSMCSDSAISCLHLIGVLRALCMIQKLLFCHWEYKVSISPLCSAFYFLPLFWCWSSWSNSLVEPIGWPQGQVFSVCETRKLCGDRNWTACPLFLRIQWYHWRGFFSKSLVQK